MIVFGHICVISSDIQPNSIASRFTYPEALNSEQKIFRRRDSDPDPPTSESGVYSKVFDKVKNAQDLFIAKQHIELQKLLENGKLTDGEKRERAAEIEHSARAKHAMKVIQAQAFINKTGDVTLFPNDDVKTLLQRFKLEFKVPEELRSTRSAMAEYVSNKT